MLKSHNIHLIESLIICIVPLVHKENDFSFVVGPGATHGQGASDIYDDERAAIPQNGVFTTAEITSSTDGSVKEINQSTEENVEGKINNFNIRLMTMSWTHDNVMILGLRTGTLLQAWSGRK